MRPLSNSAECPDVMDPERGSVGSGAVVALYRTVAGRVPACKCRARRVKLRGRLVPLSGYQVRSGEIQVQRSSAEPAKTQLPPYGGLREFELKCLRSHPTLLRFSPQALSGAPVLS